MPTQGKVCCLEATCEYRSKGANNREGKREMGMGGENVRCACLERDN